MSVCSTLISSSATSGAALRFLRLYGSFLEFFTSIAADPVFTGVTDLSNFPLPPVFTGVLAKLIFLIFSVLFGGDPWAL